jgi:hypothetical protein
LQRAFNKYGIENVKFFIIEEIQYEKKIILEREQYYIDKTKERGRCANVSDASFGDTKTGHPNREIIIEKTSKTIQKNMDNLTGEERKEKFGNPGELNGMFGKKHSKKSRKMMSDANLGRTGNLNGMFGKKHSKETKEKLSTIASQRTGNKNPFYGKMHSEETKRRISEKKIGTIPANAMAISVFGQRYSSFKEASEVLGIPHTTIRWRCLSENEKFNDYKIL